MNSAEIHLHLLRRQVCFRGKRLACSGGEEKDLPVAPGPGSSPAAGPLTGPEAMGTT